MARPRRQPAASRLSAMASHLADRRAACAAAQSSPQSSARLARVPTLDLCDVAAAPSIGSLHAGLPVIAQIRDACATWGFFQVINHGVTEERIEAFERAMVGFFAQDRSVKEAVRRTEHNSKGWYDDELTKQRVDWKEGFDVGAQNGSLDLAGLDGFNQWPAVDGFEATIRDYFGAMEALSAKLTGCMALGLGMEPTYFVPEFEQCHSSYLRLNHYPPCPELPAGFDSSRTEASVWDSSSGEIDPWSISHHTDAGAVTVLHQTQVRSLQVLQPRDGQWYDVEPRPGAFVINTGDIMRAYHRFHTLRSLCGVT